MSLQKDWPLITLVSLTFLLTIVWFKDGFMYGGGETQIPFYRPDYIEDLTRHTWWDFSIGTGVTGTVWFASWPFFKVASLIFKLTGSVFTQALFFGTIFLMAFISSYLVGKEIFGKSSRYRPFLASLFYVFNPYVQATIWHRFLLPSIASFGLLPLFLWLFIKGIKSKNFVYALYISLTTFLLGVVYLFPGSIVTLLIPPFIYLVFYSVKKRTEPGEVISAWIFFAIAGLIWLGINLWWIIPGYKTASGFLVQEMTLEGALGSLVGVSRENTLSYSLRIMSPHYFFVEPAWGGIYNTFVFRIFSFVGPIIAFWGMFRGWKKSVWIAYFATLSIVGVFLAKGTNPPLGQEFFETLFSLFPESRIFRNPQEKLGLLITFGYAYLFSWGIFDLFKLMKRKSSKLLSSFVIGAILIVSLVVYPHPMWLGTVINFSINEPAYISVPDYYTQAEEFFQKDKEDFRILALPLMGHGIIHNWEKVYRGGELSRDVFSKPVLGRWIYLPNREFYEEFNQVTDKKWFYEILPLLNIKYILVRDDIDHNSLRVPDPKKVLQDLHKSSRVMPVASFGKLYIYEVDKKLRKPHVFAENRVFEVSENKEMFELLNEGKLGVFVFPNSESQSKRDFSSVVPNSKLPPISYTKIGADNYRVWVKSADGPFVLVFSEGYDSGWYAKIDGEKLPHYFINGFANGFLVDRKGDYQIQIEFKGREQSREGLKLGLIILTIALFLGITYNKKMHLKKLQ